MEQHIKIQSPPDEAQLPTIPLFATGGQGNLFWFVDGQAVNTIATRSLLHYRFKKKGDHQVSVIDSLGKMVSVDVMVL